MNRHGSMNRVYRLVWNLARSAWVPMAETARGRGKSGRSPAASRARVAAAGAAAASALALTPLAQAGPAPAVPTSTTSSPTGGQIVSGKGNISQSGNTTTVDQASQTLSINWATFNIAPQETVDFVQPNSSAVAVNRIAGNNGSVILGHLDANGQVYLINPNGIIFGKGAEVNVGGLVASTLALNGDPSGNGVSLSGTSAASVENQGTITAAPGGYVALLANKVSNTGVITAQLGTVALGAGNALTLTFSGNNLVHLQVDQSVLKSLAQNGGLIQADGGQVILSAGAKNAVLASVVNNTGVIEARTVQNHEGTITLLGGMQAGTVEVGGTLDASAPSGGGGGHINTSAAQVEVADDAHITTAAAHGLTGSWVVDPNDFTVAPSGGDITGATLSSELGSTSVTLESSAGAKAGTGSVNVDDNVSWGANTTLTLTASDNVNVNNSITATGASAGLIINANTANGSQTANGAGNLVMGANASITLSGSNASLSIATGDILGAGATINLPNVSPTSSTALVIGGISYTVINSLGAAGSATGTDLQGIEGNLSKDYALGSNINAAATSTWNSGAGFNPIGSSATPFAGAFDGLGHTINGLVINRPTQSDVGLFGYGHSALIQNVGLVGGSVSGGRYTGGLIGFAAYGSYINNSYNTGSVSGSNYVGGLVGEVSFGNVSNSHATGPVTGTSGVGGLVGSVQYGSISNSYASGAVTGTTGVGGLVGYLYGSIYQSYATGNVTGSTDVGGLVGGSSYSYMYGSFATGQVSGATNVGGLVGELFGQIESCYATGNVSSTGSYVGGLVGHNYYGSYIDSSHATGSVTGVAYVGGLVGRNDYGTISNSYATGTVTASGSYAGGLVGYNYEGTVSNSYATGHVTGASYVGGLVGENFAYGSITNSYATGAVNGSGFSIGGLAGINEGSISDSYASGNVTLASGGSIGGGLVGSNDGFQGGNISNSYATGSVTGGSNIGGLVGLNVTGGITNSYSTGSVSGTYSVGGLVGYNYGTITNVYSTGHVSGSSETGGLVGYNYGGFVVTNGYWNVTTSGQSTSAAGRGLTTSQMQSASNFSGFSFTTTPGGAGWVIVDSDGTLNNASGATGGTYPMLASEYSTTIVNAHQLQLMAMNLSADYVLGANINASATGNGTDVWAGGGFAPIGGEYNPFNDIFDGQGHTISNLTIYLPSQYYVGLFGNTNYGSTVRNVGLVGGSVTGAGIVGGLAGFNEGTITNSYSTGNVSGSSVVGGLVGYNFNVISNSYATGNVSGGSYVGGLVGYFIGGSISNSHASGSVTGASDVGGLVGYNYEGTISTSYATGNVSGTGSYVGGLVGNAYGGSIANSFATGNVSGVTIVGGLVGWNDFDFSISNSYATGNVSGSNYVGGLVGYNSFYNINDSYSTGHVSGSQNVGGLVGFNSSGSVTNSFWNVTTSGVATSAGGGVGMTTAQMQNQANFTSATSANGNVNPNWDFADTWVMYNGYTYPLLTAFMTPLTVTANNDTFTYNATTFSGGAGVTYSSTPNGNLLGTLSYGGSSQGASNAGSYSIAAQGLYSTQFGYDITFVGGTLTINQAPVTVSGLSATSRPYNASTADTLSGTPLFSGLQGGQSLGLGSASATLSGPNAGTESATANITLGNGTGLASNYYLVQEPSLANVTITPAVLTITGLSGTGRTYNASTVDVLNGTPVLNGLVAGQTLTLGNDVDGTLASANAGSEAVTTAISLANGTGLASNYTLTQPTLANVTISPALLTVTGLSGTGRAYNASTVDVLSGTPVLNGLVAGQTLTLGNDADGTLASANAGSEAVTTAISLANGTGLASNYTLTQPTLANVTISPALLTVTGLSGTGRAYNASTVDVLNGTPVLNGLVAGQTLTLGNDVDGTLASANAGSEAVTTAISLANGTGLASNYTLTQPTLANVTISPALLTVTGLSGTGRAYNASTVDVLSGTPVLNGLVAGQTLTLGNDADGTLASANAGSEAVTTAISLANGTGLASNYTLTQPTLANVTISPALLTITGLSGTGRTYNASTVDALSGTPVVNGLVGGQTLTLGNDVDGTLASANTGSEAVSTAITLANGTGLASNYTLTQPTLANVTISPALLTITGLSGTGRTYNASTVDVLSGTPVVNGLVSGQTLTLGNDVDGTLASANAGSEAVSTAITLANGTGLASNYTLTQPTLANVTISPAPLTVTGLSGTSRTYNGSKVDALSGTPVLNGLVGGQTLTLDNDTDGTLASANAGSEALSSAITLANGTGLAGNYTLTQPTLSNVTISQLASVTWVGAATGSWANPANWAGGAIPDFSNVATVVIPAGKTVTFGSAVGPTTLQKLVSAGTLDVTGGTLDVTGNVTTAGYEQAGGTLDVGGALTVHSTGGAVTLGNIDAGSMSITATAGAITQLAASTLDVTAVTTLTADNGVSGSGDVKYAIALTNSTDKFAGAVSADGSTIGLDDSTGLTVSLDSTRAVSLTAAGAMDVSGTIGTNLTTVTTGGGSSTTTFGTTTVGNNLTVTSPGAVTTTTLTTKLIVGGAGTHTANSHVTVNGVNGAIIK